MKLQYFLIKLKHFFKPRLFIYDVPVVQKYSVPAFCRNYCMFQFCEIETYYFRQIEICHFAKITTLQFWEIEMGWSRKAEMCHFQETEISHFWGTSIFGRLKWVVLGRSKYAIFERLKCVILGRLKYVIFGIYNTTIFGRLKFVFSRD